MSTAFQAQVISLVFEGVFEQFPTLKIVLIEGGFAWLPPLVVAAGSALAKLRDEVPHLKRLPSEFFAEHVWLTTQPMEEPRAARAVPGDAGHAPWLQDRLMFATDYPHWDFDDPTRRCRRSSCPTGFAAKLMAENARALYKLPDARRRGSVSRTSAGDAETTLTCRSRSSRTVDEIPPGGRKIVEVGGRSIGVFNVGGEFFALRNRCPHQGGPLCLGITLGFLRSAGPGEFHYSRAGEILRCPWHGWEFDMRTGQSWFDPAASSSAATRSRSCPASRACKKARTSPRRSRCLSSSNTWSSK